jgi:hypothetical protein
LAEAKLGDRKPRRPATARSIRIALLRIEEGRPNLIVKAAREQLRSAGGVLLIALMGERAGNVLGPSANHAAQPPLAGSGLGRSGSKNVDQTRLSEPSATICVPRGVLLTAQIDVPAGNVLAPSANHTAQPPLVGPGLGRSGSKNVDHTRLSESSAKICVPRG